MNEEFDEYAARAGIQDARDKNIAFFAWNARQPEIDALVRDNGTLKKGRDIEMRERLRLQYENAALKAEAEKLRKDAEQLDFLARPGIELRRNYDPEELMQFAVFLVTGWPNDREWTELGQGRTVREAVDTAMKETK